MSYQQTIFVNDEYYHLYNRSVGSINLFASTRSINRILDLVDYYRFPQEIRYSKFIQLPIQQRENYLQRIIKTQQPIVELYTFSFNIDHYHLLLKQLREGGIKQFISNVQNGFAKYFNIRKNRHGSVFQNPFKGVRIETEEQFKHVSRYIHLQPVTSYLIEFEKLSEFEANSFVYYANKNILPRRLFKSDNEKSFFINTKLLINMFGIADRYNSFVANQVDYQRTLDSIKRLLPPELRRIRRVSS